MAIVLALVVGLPLSLYLSVTISPDPENSFWVERNEAVMPVWVRGNIDSGVFVISIALIFAVNLALNLATSSTGQWSAWWSIWALLGWGLGVAVHGLVVWLARPNSQDHESEGAS